MKRRQQIVKYIFYIESFLELCCKTKQMATTSTTYSKSLLRTDSSGQLNVFIVLRLKHNSSLKIISRENLPPALRSGKLVLEQKITIRDKNRTNTEGVIVFMRTY